MNVLIKGAGVAGLVAAQELVWAGIPVCISDPRRDEKTAASWFAGGMLAPWCEHESADQMVLELGASAADWWDMALPGHVTRAGTLVVAPARDRTELARFAARTTGFAQVDGGRLGELEPDLGGRFQRGLHFAGEAHLDPRAALTGLRGKLQGAGVRIVDGIIEEDEFDLIIDCTGMARASTDTRLRGVRGEMLILQSRDLALSRPVRLLHPRFPIYIVPRSQGRFMVGATMIESDASGPITARSTMELLNAAYSLHPAFGEAVILETGVGVRPAYEDNLPRVEKSGRTISINGLYRHGFLMAPAMARQAARLVMKHSKTREPAYETDG